MKSGKQTCSLRMAALIVLSAFSVAATPLVIASPISLNFTGQILPGSYTYNVGGSGLSGNWDNRQFSGSLVFDTDTADYISTDTLTREQVSSYSPWMSTTLYLPDGVVVSGDHASENHFLTQVYRNYSNPPNRNYLSISVLTQKYFPNHNYLTYFALDWNVGDHSGASSTLFSDPNGGLSWSQPLNLSGKSQTGGFNIFEMDERSAFTYNYNGNFVLFSITASQVPEPTTLALLCLGLAGLGFSRRKQ